MSREKRALLVKRDGNTLSRRKKKARRTLKWFMERAWKGKKRAQLTPNECATLSLSVTDLYEVFTFYYSVRLYS